MNFSPSSFPELIENESIDICGRKFPVNVVKDWSDINILNEIGDGDFGKVYQGYLHLNKVQRYVFRHKDWKWILYLKYPNTYIVHKW